MERYQHPTVNIMTTGAYPRQVRARNCTSSTACTSDTILTCPAGTVQDPRYLMISFSAPSKELMTAKVSKKHKEQEVSMFIAASDSQLIIGMSVQYIAEKSKVDGPSSNSDFIWQQDFYIIHVLLMCCMHPLLGGDEGHALCLREDLEEGYSEPCDTFKSVPLCKGHFKIQSLEVWGIQNSISLSHCFPSP